MSMVNLDSIFKP